MPVSQSVSASAPGPALKPQEFDDAGAKLQVAFSLAHDPLVSRARPLLRKRVFTFVEEKKAAGWSAERIVAALKRLARAAGLRLTESPSESPTFADRIYSEATQWALSRYNRRPFRR
jgi:hypothetical protein